MAAPISVLIVDDHPVVREGLEAILARQHDMTVAGTARSGEEAVELFPRLRPDVSLMDLRMPGMGGVEAVRVIRVGFPTARFLILTTYDGDENIHRALEAGAQGYLLKDARREELLQAIRGVHAGQRHIPASVASRLVEYGPRSDLTARELEVLKLIAEGLSNKEIGGRLGITEGTVKGYVNQIIGKLGVSDRTGAVTRALQRGLLRLR